MRNANLCRIGKKLLNNESIIKTNSIGANNILLPRNHLLSGTVVNNKKNFARARIFSFLNNFKLSESCSSNH